MRVLLTAPSLFASFLHLRPVLLLRRPTASPLAGVPPSNRVHLVTVATPQLDALGAVRADDDWPDSLGAAVSTEEFFSPRFRERRNAAFAASLGRLVEAAAGDGSVDPEKVEKHLVTAEARRLGMLLLAACIIFCSASHCLAPPDPVLVLIRCRSSRR